MLITKEKKRLNFRRELHKIYEEESLHFGTYQKIDKLFTRFIELLKEKQIIFTDGKKSDIRITEEELNKIAS